MPSMASLILRAVARAANSAAWAASRCGTAAAAAAAARSGSGGAAAARAGSGGVAPSDPLMRASSVAARANRGSASSGSNHSPIDAQRSQIYGSRSTAATLPAPFNGPPFVKPDRAIFEADEKDLESDQAIWALYERWCKFFNQKRDRDEMARRFSCFKETVLMVEENKKSDLPYRLGINQFADGKVRELQGCSNVEKIPHSASPNFSS